jgi:hypothetical protein
MQSSIAIVIVILAFDEDTPTSICDRETRYDKDLQ